MFITDKTQGEDEAYYLLEFEGGALGIIENIWGQRGEMDDRIEVYGADGYPCSSSGRMSLSSSSRPRS